VQSNECGRLHAADGCEKTHDCTHARLFPCAQCPLAQATRAPCSPHAHIAVLLAHRCTPGDSLTLHLSLLDEVKIGGVAILTPIAKAHLANCLT
jgi:hypothetical protein